MLVAVRLYGLVRTPDRQDDKGQRDRTFTCARSTTLCPAQHAGFAKNWDEVVVSVGVLLEKPGTKPVLRVAIVKQRRS